MVACRYLSLTMLALPARPAPPQRHQKRRFTSYQAITGCLVDHVRGLEPADDEMGLLGMTPISNKRRGGRKKRRRTGAAADDDDDENDDAPVVDIVQLAGAGANIVTPWDRCALTVAGCTGTTTDSIIAEAGRAQRAKLLSSFIANDLDLTMISFRQEIALMKAEEAANGVYDTALDGVFLDENWVVYRTPFEDDEDPVDRRDDEIETSYQVLNLMLKLLDEIPRRYGLTTADRRPYTRTVAQKEFHRHFLCADLGNIFHKNLASQIPTIKTRYGLTPTARYVAVGAPRRLGKTFSVANYVAAAHLSIPGDTTTVFSPAERVSKWFKETVADMMTPMMVNFPQIMPQISTSERVVTFLATDDKRHLKCLPCSESGTRGVDGSRVIAEEAAMLPAKMIGAVLTPLLSKADVSFMAISSVKGSTNAFTALMELPSFSKLLIEMVCARHAAEGVTDVCSCNASLRPAHLPVHQMAAVRDILVALDMQDDYERELLGRITGNAGAAFLPEHVEALFTRSSFSPASSSVRPGYVFIVTDPNGGGASDYACATLYLSQTGRVVVCLYCVQCVQCVYLEDCDADPRDAGSVLPHEASDDGDHERLCVGENDG